jgi:hypothetical protein
MKDSQKLAKSISEAIKKASRARSKEKKESQTRINRVKSVSQATQQ